jgi:hypothetical protein
MEVTPSRMYPFITYAFDEPVQINQLWLYNWYSKYPGKQVWLCNSNCLISFCALIHNLLPCYYLQQRSLPGNAGNYKLLAEPLSGTK